MTIAIIIFDGCILNYDIGTLGIEVYSDHFWAVFMPWKNRKYLDVYIAVKAKPDIHYLKKYIYINSSMQRTYISLSLILFD